MRLEIFAPLPVRFDGDQLGPRIVQIGEIADADFQFDVRIQG
jgi:hypothetical protein